MDKRIKVFRRNGAWYVDFIGDEEVERLMGTTQIQTPFLASTPADEVLRTIRERNPEYLITIERG